MTDTVRLTRQIHYFVRGWLDWDDSLALIQEISGSEEWIEHLIMDMELYSLAKETDLDFDKDLTILY